MRILVTEGVGFIGSHLVDKLMENEENKVIVADNYFTGSKNNIKKWIGHPRFELIHHGIVSSFYYQLSVRLKLLHTTCALVYVFFNFRSSCCIYLKLLCEMIYVNLRIQNIMQSAQASS
ncbi:hypothetical protein TanjilG_07150 [Lupinus angustifolius]|uniref:UDP-glucuronate decarboxylase n=1 Tax=Lupinus angustifolius TaxID=3871 RepID=A0A1J7GMV8_LUPAN|nr:hypothetical protein TanjilG_07150 [Lupinus angustifolius]